MKTHTAKKPPDKKTYYRSELARRLSPERMTYGIHSIEQNDFFRRVLLVKNFPTLFSVKCMFATLAQTRNTTFSMHIGPMAKSQGKRLIDVQMKNIRAKSYKRAATEQIEAGVEQESMIQFYQDLNRGNHKIYTVNVFVEVYGKSPKELETRVDGVVAELAGCGVTVEQLSYEQKDGFLGVYPLGEDKFGVAANNMPAISLAALYPFSYSSKNDPEGMLLGKTADGGNLFVDFFLRNTQFANGNFVIIGESGQGKSYLMKKILSQLIAKKVSCFELDPNGEYNDLFRKLGGTVINVADGRVKINPFEIRVFNTDEHDNEQHEAEAFNHKSAFYQHLSWLKSFFKVLIPALEDKEMAAVMILVKDMYIQHGIVENTDPRATRPEDYPTFTTLYEYINDVFRADDERYPMIPRDMLRSLLLLFKDAYDGSLGFLFNGITNVVNYNLINYDLSELLQGSRERTEAVLYNIMTYVWNRITQRAGPLMFALDELYLVANRYNLEITNYLKEFIKQARKYDAIIGTATQNLGDFLDPAIETITAPLFNNPMYKFLFYPSDLDLAKVKNLLQLTDGEVGCIRTPNRGHCLFKSGGDKYSMQVGTLPYEAGLFGSAGGR